MMKWAAHFLRSLFAPHFVSSVDHDTALHGIMSLMTENRTLRHIVDQQANELSDLQRLVRTLRSERESARAAAVHYMTRSSNERAMPMNVPEIPSETYRATRQRMDAAMRIAQIRGAPPPDLNFRRTPRHFDGTEPEDL